MVNTRNIPKHPMGDAIRIQGCKKSISEEVDMRKLNPKRYKNGDREILL